MRHSLLGRSFFLLFLLLLLLVPFPLPPTRPPPPRIDSIHLKTTSKIQLKFLFFFFWSIFNSTRLWLADQIRRAVRYATNFFWATRRLWSTWNTSTKTWLLRWPRLPQPQRPYQPIHPLRHHLADWQTTTITTTTTIPLHRRRLHRRQPQRPPLLQPSLPLQSTVKIMKTYFFILILCPVVTETLFLKVKHSVWQSQNYLTFFLVKCAVVFGF